VICSDFFLHILSKRTSENNWQYTGLHSEVALQRAEMRMVRWMCNVKLKDRVPSTELRERLGIDDIILIL